MRNAEVSVNGSPYQRNQFTPDLHSALRLFVYLVGVWLRTGDEWLINHEGKCDIMSIDIHYSKSLYERRRARPSEPVP
jgi:hypothetical protein